MLTRSFSSKPPSLALAELVVTPAMRVRESATFLSGILPMSSALTTSTTLVVAFLASRDCSTEARIPVTTTSSIVLVSALEGAAGPSAARVLGPNNAMATAVPTKVDLAILIDFHTPLLLVPARSRAAPSAPLPLTCQYSTTLPSMTTQMHTNYCPGRHSTDKQSLARHLGLPGGTN